MQLPNPRWLELATATSGANESRTPVTEALNSSGQPLDAATRAYFEPRFGYDFGRVRVHVDAKASESARAMDALAYTAGRDVVFGEGQYRPGTPSGQKLLAHELTHVIQQHANGSSSATIMRKPDPAAKKDPPALKAPTQTCPAPTGPGNHPSAVSPTLIDRAMGKFAKVDGDPGEGCVETPYIAGKKESVCTIGYGHQIPDCPVLSRATGQKPTAEEIEKAAPARPAEFMCACEGTKTFDCKGPQGKKQVTDDAAGKASYVRKVVPVDLDQAQFDALVDLALHKGSLPADLLDAIKKYWCTDEGKNYVRELYLKSSLQPFPKAFAARRQHRVWGAAASQQPAAPPQNSQPTPGTKPELCLALDSMRRSAEGICRLAGESDARCTNARAKVEENRKRLEGKCV